MQKVENSLSSKKKKRERKLLVSLLSKYLKQPRLWKFFVWYPVCTCDGSSVTVETEAPCLFSIERSELYVRYLVQTAGPVSGL